MPRVVEDLDPVVSYEPEFDDNRLEDEPMWVDIEPMSTAEVKAYQRQHGHKLQGKGGLSRAQKMMDAIITRRVHAVHGYVIKGLEITNGQMLAEHGEPEVTADIFGAIMSYSKLKEGLKKKSEPQSDSCSQTTVQKTGTVDSASADRGKTESVAGGLSVRYETAAEMQTRGSDGDSSQR